MEDNFRVTSKFSIWAVETDVSREIQGMKHDIFARAHCYVWDRTGQSGCMNLMSKIWLVDKSQAARNHIPSLTVIGRTVYCTYTQKPKCMCIPTWESHVVFAALQWAEPCLSLIINNNAKYMYVYSSLQYMPFMWSEFLIGRRTCVNKRVDEKGHLRIACSAHILCSWI